VFTIYADNPASSILVFRKDDSILFERSPDHHRADQNHRRDHSQAEADPQNVFHADMLRFFRHFHKPPMKNF
jgi:hypothetical protein